MSPGDCLHHSLILDLLGVKMDLVYVTLALARQFIPSGVIFLKGCVQQARKWLFRPKFFSLSKWAQFLHVTLDLTGKRCPVSFSAVLFFVFEKFSSTSTGGKCALRWFYCLEKQKLSLERTPPGKKLRFCIRYLWKMKEKPANLNGGLCFSIKWKATCRNWAHLDEEKNFSLKSHLRACCTQPFNYKGCFWQLVIGNWALGIWAYKNNAMLSLSDCQTIDSQFAITNAQSNLSWIRYIWVKGVLLQRTF